MAAHSPLDLDAFDSLGYTRDCLKKLSIDDLLTVDDDLVNSVQNLDSTMQTLVYENYSKFISATDAIRNIGKSVDKASEEMFRLLSVMEEVDEGAKEVDEDLKESREVVADKLRVRRQLSRVDKLLNLPATLREDVENMRYTLAAKRFTSSRAILSKHSASFSSLAKIETECNRIMSELTKRLVATLSYLSEESNPLPTPTPSAKFIFQLASALSILDSSAHSRGSCKAQATAASKRSLNQTLSESNRDNGEGFSFLHNIADAARHLNKGTKRLRTTFLIYFFSSCIYAFYRAACCSLVLACRPNTKVSKRSPRKRRRT